jgi:hypothetical protein
MKSDWNIHETSDNEEAIERWDSGQALWSIELGGLGPGYEQAIQILVVEIVRDALASTHPVSDYVRENGTKLFQDLADKTAHKHNETCLGFTGAQVGVATSFAFKIVTEGWPKVLEEIRADPQLKERMIQISWKWPKATE